jgi:photosystem II stability/assembly factor-like uncharacterized protein
VDRQEVAYLTPPTAASLIVSSTTLNKEGEEMSGPRDTDRRLLGGPSLAGTLVVLAVLAMAVFPAGAAASRQGHTGARATSPHDARGSTVVWESVAPAGITNPVCEIEAADQNVAYAVVDNDPDPGTLLKTTDYGNSWTTIGLTAGPPPFSWTEQISVVDSQTVWVGSVYSPGMGVAITTGGGGSWGYAGATAYQYALEATSSTHAWAGGHFPGEPGGFIYETNTGGGDDAAWTLVVGIGHGSCLDIESSSPSNVWAVGNGDYHGWIWHYDGSAWTDQTPTNPYPPELYGCWAVDDKTAFAVGNDKVLRTTDGGTTWDTQTAPAGTGSLMDVSALDGDTAWAVGNSGSIIETVDGGATWTTMASGTTNDLKSVYAVDAGHVWAVGSGGTVLRLVAQPAPAIASVSPKYAKVGSVVTVTGTGFGASRGASYVRFGAVKATGYVSWSATQLKVSVPAQAAGALKLSVTTSGGKSNLIPFKVLPRIAKIAPRSGAAGRVVTLTGTGFGAERGTSFVRFGKTKVAKYVSWSTTKIVCKVPATGRGAKTMKVTTSGGTSAGVTFTVK